MKTALQPVDYTLWRTLAWCGPVFLAIFTLFWGVLAGNMPPIGADVGPEGMKAHYLDNALALRIGMSVCMVGAAFYMAWGCAVSRVMRRLEGSDGMLANLELMGATATCVCVTVACGIWLTGAMNAAILSPEIVHTIYWMGWMIIDLAYMVTTFQIAAISVVFLRDKRIRPLVPSWVNWWGFVTLATFFPVSLIPFFKTGPFAFHGVFNFWIAFFAWYIWVAALSFCIIRAVGQLQVEDGLAPDTEPAPARAGTGAALPAR